MNGESRVFGVSGHTITDGDLACLETEQDVEFPVGLAPVPAWTASAEPDALLSSHRLEGNISEFVAEVVEFGDGTWLADIGILVCGRGDWPLVYIGREMPAVRTGDRFLGRGPLLVHALGVETDLPYGGVVPPRYRWRIDRLERDAPPLITVDRTSISHSRGHAEYLLHCSLLSGPQA